MKSSSNFNGWKITQLGNICDISSSKRIFASEYKTSGIPFYRGKEIIEKFNKKPISTELFISPERFNEINNKFGVPKEGDILLTSVGTLGIPYLVGNEDFYFKDGNLTWFKQFKSCNSRFLFFWFQSPFAKHQIETKSIGSTQKALTIDILKSFTIHLPPIKVQNKIVAILSSIDDKIELNNKINRNLEAQAQAIFKSWFIDFEPFGGKMPANWKTYQLKEFLPVITGKKNANVSSKEGLYPFFSCSQDIAWCDSYSFEGNAILVAGNGDFNVKFYNGKFEAYQRTYVLIPFNQNLASWLYYLIQYYLNDITSGARGSVISFITKGNLENLTFYAPESLDNFQLIDVFRSINEQIRNNRKESQRLSQLRDALLPKLMSGEILVS